jgi:predicted ArsR family transcriptional regulator
MPAGLGRVDGTREAILTLLRRRERMGVEELAHELGLAGATVRRHLDVLQRDNYVSVTQVRGGTGRPRHLFSLTEAGAELFPHHYVRLTQRLLHEIVALGPEETAGRSGEEIASLVFEKMSKRLADEYRPRIRGRSLEERVLSVVDLIAEEGLDFEVAHGRGGLQLLGRGCPCTRMSEVSGQTVAVHACDHDRQMLEALLDAPVRTLDASEVPYDFQCGYQVLAPGALSNGAR